MLNLFANLFTRPVAARSVLPAALIKQLIERAVDGTDPRLRILSGYARRLRAPVLHAADYVIGLIDSLSEPLVLDSRALNACPLLEALLYSPGQAEQLLAGDAALTEARASHPAVPITALLVVQRTEKHKFGVAQVGDKTLTDVAQTTVSFSQHRFLEPAPTAEACRRALKRRAFDLLLSIALAKLSERKLARTELGSRRAVLRSKLAILQRGADFAGHHPSAQERSQLQTKLVDIEAQLAAHGPVDRLLDADLDAIAGVLANAEQHIWLQAQSLNLDKFYVTHDQPVASVPQLDCRDLCTSTGQRLMLQLVTLAAD